MQNTRVRIKMCGMTREEDIAQAVALGVDAIGVIFYPGSARYLSLERAKMLLKSSPAFVDVVAVMVNPKVREVEQIIQELPIQWLQFHGDETAAFCEQFNFPYIKSVAVKTSLAITQAMQVYEKASAILLDTHSPASRGGSGVTFDWKLIPVERTRPIILAGGLNAANVQAAVKASLAYAVDVCSGIEATAGIKDHHKMASFMKALEHNDE